MIGAGYGQMGRVLIVDDDPAICDVLSDILGAEGFEAACAQTDRAAYALIPTLPTFRALIVDINLRHGTTGFDVARFARQVIPDLLVIYMSGETLGSSLDAFGVPASEFLRKPFVADDLLKTIAAQKPRGDDPADGG